MRDRGYSYCFNDRLKHAPTRIISLADMPGIFGRHSKSTLLLRFQCSTGGGVQRETRSLFEFGLKLSFFVRLKIAYTLVSSLPCLHTIGWFHSFERSEFALFLAT
jgi:hypothetical protein